MYKLNAKHKKIGRIQFGIISSAIILFFLLANNAAAQYGSFGGRPAYPRAENPRTQSIFVHTLEPGKTQDEGILVANNTGEQKTILIYGVDSVPSTGGAFACQQMSDTPNDVGAWMTFDKTEVTLGPGTNEIIPFTISVPNNTSVGEHNGCVITQEKKNEVPGAGAHLSFRSGLRVVITVPGVLDRNIKIINFIVTPQKNGDFSLQSQVKNTGNVSIDANAQVMTKDFLGRAIADDSGQYLILRNTASDWNFILKKPFWGGFYQTTLTVSYDKNSEASVGVSSGKTLTKLDWPSEWYFSLPSTLALVIELAIFLLIISCLFLLVLARRRKKMIKKNWGDYTIKSGEEINDIAAKFKISWKLLAKANKLKPPYALQAGKKIKVPPIKK